MSAPAPAAAPAAASSGKATPVEGNGILITASKIHTAHKTELLNTIAQAEFDPAKGGRAPTLVGILATKKEDAKAYSEVSATLNSG